MTLEQLQDRLDQDLPEIKLSHLEKSYTWASFLLAAMIPNATINQLMGFDPLRGVIFTGKPGNGRHTTAEALVGSLCPSKYSRFLRLSGGDLDMDAEDVCAVIDGIAELARENESLCLLLDQPEESRWSKLAQDRLAGLLNRSEASIFVIIIAAEPTMICAALRRRFMLCHCPEPSSVQREEWLAVKVNEPVPLQVDGMSVKELAKETEDFSWRQMADLWNCMKLRLVWKVVERQKEFMAEKKPLKKVLSDGLVHLQRGDLMEILHSLKDQLPPRQAAVAPVQILAGAAQTEAAEQTEQIDKDKAAELVEFHSHPERMSGAQLLDVDF